MTVLEPSNGTKMMFLIRRKTNTSREELLVHWFKNHMPDVIDMQSQLRERDRPHAWRYIATLFDSDPDGHHPWDGVAQLWYDEPWPPLTEAIGVEPADTFQEKAEPYMSWATTEYVYLDGELPIVPLTLNDAFPTTRSGFHKTTLLAALRDQRDRETFIDYWLNDHAPRATQRQQEAGALRYVVSISQEPDEPFVGMAEIYFDGAESAHRYFSARERDRLEDWMDPDSTLVLTSQTEMIGIP